MKKPENIEEYLYILNKSKEGYSHVQIAEMTGLSRYYVRKIHTDCIRKIMGYERKIEETYNNSERTTGEKI